MKKLVLGAVYRLTTQAQDFSRESEQFLYLVYVCLSCKCNRANRAYNSRITAVIIFLYICMLSFEYIMIDICKCVCWFLATVF